MDNKEIIKSVRALIFGTEEVVEAAFLDVKTSEGLVLRVAEVKEGESVMIISEDGENVSGEAEYVLEDGTKLVVNAEGVIASVEEAEAEEEEEVVEEEMSEEVNPLEERIANLESGIEKVLSMFSTIDEVNKDLTEKLEAFSKAPAEEEIVVARKTPLEEKRYNALSELSKYKQTKK